MNPTVGPPTIMQNPPMGIADTGTTGKFLSLDYLHNSCLQDIKETTNPIQVEEPSGNIIQSTHTATIPWNQAPTSAACTGHLFPSLKGKCLISIPMFCDAGCTATFTPTEVLINYQGNVIIRGNRCPTTGLWLVPLTTTPSNPHQANAVTLPHKVPDMVAFSHATLFSPTLPTLQIALDKGYISNFPGLTSKSLKQHPPKSVAMLKGHMDQTKAGVQSTQPKLPKQEQEAQIEEILFPKPLHNGARTNFCYAAISHPFAPTGQIFTDQTGKFPVTSTRGNAYVFVLYDYDSNTIHPVAIKNRSADSILDAYKQVHQELVQAGCRPKLQRLDNECSTALKNYMSEENVEFQLVPPGTHRRNAAERAIRTFKNHFIAGLCTADPKFPLNLWDRLVPQSKITLNLLRGSRLNPKLSGYAQLYGPFDFNKTPMAPPGTRVLVHEKSSNRPTWAAHGLDAWYIGPAMEHYRCYTTYVWSTRAERISDTVEWFPHEVKMPTASTMDLLLAATQDILHCLQQPQINSPLDPLTDSETKALQAAVAMLNNKLKDKQPLRVEDTTTDEPLRVEENTLDL